MAPAAETQVVRQTWNVESLGHPLGGAGAAFYQAPDGPDEADQLARHRCGHFPGRLSVIRQLRELPMQTLLGLPRDRGHVARQRRQHLLQPHIHPWPVPRIPRGFSEHVPQMRVAGPRNAALRFSAPARVLGRHEARVAHQLRRFFGSVETSPPPSRSWPRSPSRLLAVPGGASITAFFSGVADSTARSIASSSHLS